MTLIAVVREGKSIHNPGAEFVFASGDVLVLLGGHKELDEASQILSPPGDREGS